MILIFFVINIHVMISPFLLVFLNIQGDPGKAGETGSPGGAGQRVSPGLQL